MPSQIRNRPKYLRDGRAPIPRSEKTSKVMSANKGKNTKPEILLRGALRKCGLRGFRSHVRSLPGRPDIVFAQSKVGIFINGCFWHRCPYCRLPLPRTHRKFWMNKFNANKERDKRKVRELKKQGWNVMVVWECQIRKNVKSVINRIRLLIT